MINRRALTMFVVAVLISVGAAWVANNWLQARLVPQEAKVQGKPTVVAALKISFGQKIEGAHLKVVNMPDDSVPNGAYTDPNEVIGKVANQAIFPGEALISKRVVDQLEGSTLSAIIAPRKRAMTVRVNDVIGVAGFLLPGNRVDVVATSRVMGNLYVRTILQDVKVLAVDQTASPEKDKPVIVRAVTLELTPEESEILVKATNEGSVQLTLRNPLDDRKIAETGDQAEAAEQPELSPAMLEKKYVTLRDDGGIKLLGLQKPALLPGNRVDIIAASGYGDQAKQVAILQDIKVVAVLHKRGDSTVVGGVTLELTAHQSKTLANNTTESPARLTLRAPVDNQMVAETEAIKPPQPTAPVGRIENSTDAIRNPAINLVSTTL